MAIHTIDINQQHLRQLRTVLYDLAVLAPNCMAFGCGTEPNARAGSVQFASRADPRDSHGISGRCGGRVLRCIGHEAPVKPSKSFLTQRITPRFY